MTHVDRSSKQHFTGKHMLACMIGFFGIVIAVNLSMAALANRSWTGLVVKNSYVASQEFNALLRAGRDQAALGWRASLTYRDGALGFSLTDRFGAPMSADKVEARIGRPATETSDASLFLDREIGGRFAVRHHLAPGQWDVRVTARVGTRAHITEFRIRVPQFTASTPVDGDRPDPRTRP